MKIENIRAVVRQPDGSYTCLVDLVEDDGTPIESGAEYSANADDPCSDVFSRIEAGDFAGEITDWTPPPVDPTEEKERLTRGIIEERRRRLALGFDFDFGDSRGIHRIGTTDDDMIGWSEVDKWSQAMTALGHAGETLTIVTETGPVDVTPLEWQEIIAAGSAFRQPIWQASFALQAQDPIPENYTDDQWWPESTHTEKS